MQRKALAAVILAAGRGVRMKSSLAKVLHPLSAKPLLSYVLETVYTLEPDRVVLVTGFQSDKVAAACRGHRLEFVEQKEQLGTGHAILQTQSALQDFKGDVLVLCGDMPFIKRSTLETLMKCHWEKGSHCTLLALKTEEPKDFGRVIRNEKGRIVGIVENRDARGDQKTIDEYSAGVYCFEREWLFEAINHIDNNNSQREYYLTDVVRYAAQSGLIVQSVQTRDAKEIFGINSEEDLKKAEQILLETS